jgi:hypothetical protein
LPIKELNELLTKVDQYKQHNTDMPILDVAMHVEANYVSELLLYMELKSPRLTREFVKRLQLGDAYWKTVDGKERYINEDFNFELLEKLGIIFFEHDWLRVSARLPRSQHDEYVHETIKPLLKFVRSLKDIIDANNNFQPLKMGVDNETYARIVPDNYLFEKLNVDIENTSNTCIISIKTENRGMDSLISDYYWKKVIKSPHRTKILDRFYSLKPLLSDLISTPSSSIFNHDERKIFSTLCMERISNSNLLNMPFEQFQNILYSHSNFDANLIATTTRININLAPVPNQDKTPKIEKNSSIPLSTEEIVNNYSSTKQKKTTNNLELVNMQNRFEHLMFYDTEVFPSLIYLVNNDLFIDYQLVRSKGDIELLLSNSLENQALRYYLLCVIPNLLDDITYDLYLLSKPNEFDIGAIQLINKVNCKYTSREVNYSEAKSNISTILSDALIKISMNNNKEKMLSLLLIKFAKGYIGNSQKNDSFEQRLVENIISDLTPKEFQKLTSVFIDEIEKIDVSGVWSKYTIYLLFLLADSCEQKNSDNLTIVLVKIREKIFSEYEKYFEFSLSYDSHCLNSDRFYDNLNWEVCNEMNLINKFIKLKPSPRKLIQGFFFEENNNSIYYMQSVRSFVQVLINLYLLSNAHKNEIQRVLLDILKNAGFKSEDVEFPLFDCHFSDDKYDLWNKFTETINDFDEAAFDEIVSCISDSAPLDAMMSLYSNASKQDRKNKIIEKIEHRDNWGLNKESLPAIEKSFLLALDKNKLDIAKVSLTAAKYFLNNHSWRESEHFKENIHKWSVFEYKYQLLTIYYSPDNSKDKVTLVNDVSEPKLEAKKQYQQIRTDWHKEVDLFKRYIIGLIKLENEPEKSKLIFEQLNKEYKLSMFAHLIFTSKLQALLKNESDSENYKILIKEYKANQDNFSIDTLSLNNKSDYLYALYLAGDYNEVDAECSKLIRSEKFHRSITITYSKALRKKDNLKPASKLLQDYKVYHSVELDDDELTQELKEIGIEIENSTSPLQREKIRSQVLFSNKSNDELGTIYNEIVNKSTSDLAKIVSNDSDIRIESFLYNQVFSCLKEILKRGRNLEKLIDKKDENAINDWFTSLFNQKMSNFSIRLSDQARIGSAESNKGVGETDGLISDRLNSSISMFEAMNLKSIDTTVINKHVNKITKYDRESLSPIFIVSYCYFDDFINKIHDYCKHIEGMQYLGFDIVDTVNHQLKRLDYSSDYYSVVESRYRGGKEIYIYHILIDLTLPQPKK